MGMGLKLCDSSWIIILVPDQGLLSGALSLLGRSKLGWIYGNQNPADYREWLTSFSTHRDKTNAMTLGSRPRHIPSNEAGG